MIRAQVSTIIIGEGTQENPNRTKLEGFRGNSPLSIVDVSDSEQWKPDPNSIVVEIVTDESVMALIESDEDSFVLWSEST